MSLEVADLTDDAAIRSALERDRRWAAYALCDLDPAHRPYARFIGARDGNAIRAIALVYSPPEFTVLWLGGDGDALPALMGSAAMLPRQVFVNVRPADLAALQTRYRVQPLATMLRMAVTADRLHTATDTGARLAELNSAELPALLHLYGERPDAFFTPTMLAEGVYYGAYLAGELVAAAGTHALSMRHAIATVGNVYTRPDCRARGLATAVTGAVAHALVGRGMRDLILNVAADNAPALAAYRRLGFTVYHPFSEGYGELK